MAVGVISIETALGDRHGGSRHALQQILTAAIDESRGI
jgi:hypothetical protein